MAERERKAKPTVTHKEAEELAEEDSTKTKTEEGREMLEDSEDWLDDIDAVLEENAQDFVKAYVQKGGQHHLPFSGDGGRMVACPLRRKTVRIAENYDL